MMGIDIGPPGPTLINVPAIESAVVAEDADGVPFTIVKGTLEGLPKMTYTLEFFVNPNRDPSGFGQGKAFLGSTQVTTDANGDAQFKFTSQPLVTPTGQFISATATDANGKTSEFSRDVEVVEQANIATSTSVVGAPDASAFGQPVILTATVAPATAVAATPTGTVQFQIDGADFVAPVALVDGVATSPSTATLAAGRTRSPPSIAAMPRTPPAPAPAPRRSTRMRRRPPSRPAPRLRPSASRSASPPR